MKKHFYFPFLFFILSGTIALAQPTNDDLINAVEINTLPFSDVVASADAMAATSETDEVVCKSSANAWWYEFTPDTTGDYFITSEVVGATNGGTSNDLHLGVYTGSTHPLTEVFCVDLDQGAAYGEGRSVMLTGGTSYKIRVSPDVVDDILDVTTRVRNAVIWDGSESSDWSDPDNWSTASVPTAEDVIFIEGTIPNDPIVAGGTMAVAAAIKVNNGNSLTIAEGGTLTIDSGENIGLWLTQNAGDLTVNGELNIENTTIGLMMLNGSYSIGSNGSTTIQNTSSDGVLVESSSGNITIEGELIVNNSQEDGVEITVDTFMLSEIGTLKVSNVTQSALAFWEDVIVALNGDVQIETTGSFGIIVVQSGTLHIDSTATILMNGIGVDGVYAQNAAAQVNVDGEITIKNSDNRGIRIINGTLTVNETAYVRIENAETAILLKNDLTHTLDGTISISNMSVDGIELDGAGQLNIGASAMVDIDTITFDAIYLDNASAVININGLLDLAEANDGIDIDDGTINFGTTAIVTISNIDDNGLEDVQGTNEGQITITNVGGDAINTGDADFTNEATGILILSNAGEDCIDCDGNFINNGQISAESCSEFAITDGSFSHEDGATLTVDGLIEAISFTFASGSILEPGSSPGCVTFNGDADFSNIVLNIELDGTIACTDYDQITAQGAVTITDATLNLSGSHSPTTGESFIILDNDGIDAISGTFTGLSEGSQIAFNGYYLIISYMGGDGNDVELTVDDVLPVELLYFKAHATPQGNLLQWQTAAELSNEGFEIHRSKDGQNWQILTFVKGNGTTVESHIYQWLDKSPSSGTNYYRLKQIDSDGAFAYSNIVQVTTKNETIQIFPNPLQDILYYQTDNPDSIQRVQLFDATGKLLLETTSSDGQLSLNDLPEGIYLFVLQTATERIQQHIVKK